MTVQAVYGLGLDDAPSLHTAQELGEAWRFYRKAVCASPNECTYIYAIQAGDDGPVKIGVATTPWQRLKTLQQAHYQELRGVACWYGFAWEEKQLHREFADLRIRGEWFKPHPDLIETVEWFGVEFDDWTPLTKAEREDFERP